MYKNRTIHYIHNHGYSDLKSYTYINWDDFFLRNLVARLRKELPAYLVARWFTIVYRGARHLCQTCASAAAISLVHGCAASHVTSVVMSGLNQRVLQTAKQEVATGDTQRHSVAHLRIALRISWEREGIKEAQEVSWRKGKEIYGSTFGEWLPRRRMARTFCENCARLKACIAVSYWRLRGEGYMIVYTKLEEWCLLGCYAVWLL
jgi:hypothetical protein